MNENNVVVEIPKHLVVLDVISVGVNDVSKVSKAETLTELKVIPI